MRTATRMTIRTGTAIPMSIDSQTRPMDRLFRLIQFSDSAFPVGAFAFSNGLETAAHLGIVKDAQTLGQYAESVASQAAFSDGVAALIAYRAATSGDYELVREADRRLMLFKVNAESRLMLCRMGKKLAELGVRLFNGESLFDRFLADIESGATPGTYPVAQAIAFAREELGERELYVSHQYGVVNMVLSAALRCVRVSHYDTQRILFELGKKAEADYTAAAGMGFENMHSFVPEMDIFASMHEKGQMRMFMN